LQSDTQRQTIIYALFALAYSIVGYQCYTTMGDPYRSALAEIESLRETGALPGEDWEIEAEIQKKQVCIIWCAVYAVVCGVLV
jgi:hypothetical protein